MLNAILKVHRKLKQ